MTGASVPRRWKSVVTVASAAQAGVRVRGCEVEVPGQHHQLGLDLTAANADVLPNVNLNINLS